jgi:hypothetical protein
MTLDRDAAAARVTKIFERLEGAPLAPVPIEPPPTAPAATFKQRQPDPDPLPARPNAYQHREAWLHALMGELAGPFKRLGYPIPEKVRIGVGFPSVRGIASKNQRIGECWSNERSGDDHHEIIISPVIADGMRVAGILAHELIHAAVGVVHGHKGPFRAMAHGLGLEGKMTATIEGDAFKRLAEPILDAIGPYPHAELHAMTNGRKKQVARLIKCECAECGYVARVARQWLDDQGAPHCPAHGEMMAA